jgi:hypothetical protein
MILNLLRENINSINKKMKALLDASEEVVIEMNAKKTKYMLMSCQQNERQSQNIKKLTGPLQMLKG